MPENNNEKRKLVVDFKRYSLSYGIVPKLAELRLQPIKHHDQDNSRSHGYHEVRVAIYDQSGKQVFRKSYRASYQYDRKAGDIVYDITPLIQDIVAMGLTNMTVKMTLNQDRISKDDDRNKRSMGQVDKAFLVVYSEDKFFLMQFNEMMKTQQKPSFGKNPSESFLNKLGAEAYISRPKRSVPVEYVSCHKKDFIVEFEKLQNVSALAAYFKVIMPRRYNAFLCTGHCNIKSYFQGSLNGFFRLLYHRYVPNSGRIPKPACNCKEYAGAYFLVLQNGKTEVKYMATAIVKNCACK